MDRQRLLIGVWDKTDHSNVCKRGDSPSQHKGSERKQKQKKKEKKDTVQKTMSEHTGQGYGKQKKQNWYVCNLLAD